MCSKGKRQIFTRKSLTIYPQRSGIALSLVLADQIADDSFNDPMNFSSLVFSL